MESDAKMNLDHLHNQFIWLPDGPVDFDRCFLFGAGVLGSKVKALLEFYGVDVLGFVDNNSDLWGSLKDGVPVLRPDEMSRNEESYKVVVSSMYYPAIFLQLRRMGLERDTLRVCVRSNLSGPAEFCPWLYESFRRSINSTYNDLADKESQKTFSSLIYAIIQGDYGYLLLSAYPQYAHPTVKAEYGDIVIDVGAMNGDTSLMFADAVGDGGKVYAFEPSNENHLWMLERLSYCDAAGTVIPIKHGLWDEDTELSFSTNFSEPGCHQVTEKGESRIQVLKLDSFVAQQGLTKVSLIKSDVEGAEPYVLSGAKETIRRFKPKLQISIYHQIEHLWKIKEQIDCIQPGYRYYVGQHTLRGTETVLYCLFPRA
jgi:FkbM family methyltransferase